MKTKYLLLTTLLLCTLLTSSAQKKTIEPFYNYTPRTLPKEKDSLIGTNEEFAERYKKYKKSEKTKKEMDHLDEVLERKRREADAKTNKVKNTTATRKRLANNNTKVGTVNRKSKQSVSNFNEARRQARLERERRMHERDERLRMAASAQARKNFDATMAPAYNQAMRKIDAQGYSSNRRLADVKDDVLGRQGGNVIYGNPNKTNKSKSNPNKKIDLMKGVKNERSIEELREAYRNDQNLTAEELKKLREYIDNLDISY